MEHFTPISAACGGVLIGVSAAVLWLFAGRIAGISGIVGGALSPRASDIGWRVAFILGLVSAPVLYRLIGGALPEIEISSSWAVIIAAGLLVGFGTRLGSGCTSGHGVCGMARLSKRSIAATAIFMATAFITSFVLRHVAAV
jgi:uncharacterized membrane protein YedE/YeeE